MAKRNLPLSLLAIAGVIIFIRFMNPGKMIIYMGILTAGLLAILIWMSRR